MPTLIHLTPICQLSKKASVTESVYYFVLHRTTNSILYAYYFLFPLWSSEVLWMEIYSVGDRHNPPWRQIRNSGSGAGNFYRKWFTTRPQSQTSTPLNSNFTFSLTCSLVATKLFGEGGKPRWSWHTRCFSLPSSWLISFSCRLTLSWDSWELRRPAIIQGGGIVLYNEIDANNQPVQPTCTIVANCNVFLVYCVPI